VLRLRSKILILPLRSRYMKIIQVTRYSSSPSVAKLRKAWKDGMLKLKYDRNSSQYGVKIYKAYSIKTGYLRADFHIIWTKKQVYRLQAHVSAFFDNMSMKEQQAYFSKQVDDQ